MPNSTSKCNKVELVFAPEERDVYSYSAYEIVAPLGARPYVEHLHGKVDYAFTELGRVNRDRPAINIWPRWGEAIKRLLDFEVEILGSCLVNSFPRNRIHPAPKIDFFLVFAGLNESVGNRLTAMLVSVPVSDERKRDRSPKNFTH